MKKTITLLLLLLAITAITFNSCKKGENDPFLSLKSRTGRISQDWVLSTEDYTIKNTTSSYSSSDHYTFNGTSETLTTVLTIGSSSSTTTDTYAYSEEFVMAKEGTYKSTTVDDGTTEIEEGNWSWVGKNKDQDLKNKEAFVIASTQSSGSDYTNSGKTIPPDMIFAVDKLSSKELVIMFDYLSTDTNGNTYSMSGTKTYTKK